MSKQNLITPDTPEYKKLLRDVVQLIQQGRQRVATEINSTVVLLYWAVGKRINETMRC